MLKKIALVSCVALLGACGGSGPGTEKWCEAKQAVPKSQWTVDDAKIYTQKCLIDSTTIGSEAWCEKMKEKDRGDLSVDEATDLAKHCII